MIASWGRPEDCEAASHLKALGALMPTPPPGAPGPFALSDEAKLKALASEADLTPIAVTDVYPDTRHGAARRRPFRSA